MSASSYLSPSNMEYRLMIDGPLPADWDLAWETDRSIVEEELEVAEGIGMPNPRIEERRRYRGDADLDGFFAWAKTASGGA